MPAKTQPETADTQREVSVMSNMHKYNDKKFSTHSLTTCDDLQSLRNNALIQEYASIDDNLYELIKATNPTLRMFVDLAKNICRGD